MFGSGSLIKKESLMGGCMHPVSRTPTPCMMQARHARRDELMIEDDDDNDYRTEWDIINVVR